MTVKVVLGLLACAFEGLLCLRGFEKTTVIHFISIDMTSNICVVNWGHSKTS